MNKISDGKLVKGVGTISAALAGATITTVPSGHQSYSASRQSYIVRYCDLRFSKHRKTLSAPPPVCEDTTPCPDRLPPAMDRRRGSL